MYKLRNEHTHILDVRDEEVRKRYKIAKENAASSTKTTRELYSELMAAAPEAGIVAAPNANAFGKTIREVRSGMTY